MLSEKSLHRALSEERLVAYRAPDDKDFEDCVARYLWNLALSSALQAPLHALEVTFRNAIYTGSKSLVDESKLTFKDVRCWLDATPSLLFQREQESVEDAKYILHAAGKPLTPGRLISKLSFGFWVALSHAPYEQGRTGGPALWPTLLIKSFPYLPVAKRVRSVVYHRMNKIRDIRNRVFHHEPVWDRDLITVHNEIIESIAWMNRGMAEAIKQESVLPAIAGLGCTGYRAHAERIVTRPPT